MYIGSKTVSVFQKEPVEVFTAPGIPIETREIGYALPDNFVYSHLRRTSGPQAASGEDYDLNF